MKKDSLLIDWQENWRTEWQRLSFRYNLGLSLVILVGFLLLSTRVLIYAESRSGMFFNDILLSRLPSYDFSGLIFFLIYSSLIIGMSHVSRTPYRLVPAFYVYTIVLVCRMISIYFFPLETPAGIIILRDPFVEYFTGSGKVVTKDLFFSGHTATMCIVYLFAKNKWLKMFFLTSTIAVGILLLFQHAHYTMDVVAAPFFVYFCYVMVIKIYRKSRHFTLNILSNGN